MIKDARAAVRLSRPTRRCAVMAPTRSRPSEGGHATSGMAGAAAGHPGRTADPLLHAVMWDRRHLAATGGRPAGYKAPRAAVPEPRHGDTASFSTVPIIAGANDYWPPGRRRGTSGPLTSRSALTVPPIDSRFHPHSPVGRAVHRPPSRRALTGRQPCPGCRPRSKSSKRRAGGSPCRNESHQPGPSGPAPTPPPVAH